MIGMTLKSGQCMILGRVVYDASFPLALFTKSVSV